LEMDKIMHKTEQLELEAECAAAVAAMESNAHDELRKQELIKADIRAAEERSQRLKSAISDLKSGKPIVSAKVIVKAPVVDVQRPEYSDLAHPKNILKKPSTHENISSEVKELVNADVGSTSTLSDTEKSVQQIKSSESTSSQQRGAFSAYQASDIMKELLPVPNQPSNNIDTSNGAPKVAADRAEPISHNPPVKTSPTESNQQLDAVSTADTASVSKRKPLKAFDKVISALQQERWLDALKMISTIDSTINVDRLAVCHLSRFNSPMDLSLLYLLNSQRLGEDAEKLTLCMQSLSNICGDFSDEAIIEATDLSKLHLMLLFHYTSALIYSASANTKNLAVISAENYRSISTLLKDIQGSDKVPWPTSWSEQMLSLCSSTLSSQNKSKSVKAFATELTVKLKWDERITEWKKTKSATETRVTPSKAMDALLQMTGLEAVKEKFLELYDMVKLSKEQGRELSSSNFNTRFDGNPGTGMFFTFFICLFASCWLNCFRQDHRCAAICSVPYRDRSVT
jgi:hypothetical protein